MGNRKRIRSTTVGAFLRRERLRAGLSQREVARLMGYTTSQFVSNWERGISLPPFDSLRRLARVLGCSLRELVGAVADHHYALVEAEMECLGRAFGLKISKAAVRRPVRRRGRDV